MNELRAFVDLVVPTPAADLLSRVADSTGLRWGPTPRSKFWFQTPKEHIFQFVVVLAVCVLMWHRSREFRKAAVATLATRGAGWSTLCPINRLCVALLALCFASQIYTKATRPQPLIQLGWLLMPCHLVTLGWMYVFLRDKPSQYGSSCYVGTLLVDYFWAPVAALQNPDWGDHRYPFEGYIFVLHHGLLLLLPVYFAVRYHVMELSVDHVLHLGWIPIAFYFAVGTPWAILSGLNVNYMLYPPAVKGAPRCLIDSPFYRIPSVTALVVMSIIGHTLLTGFSKTLQIIAKAVRKAQRKIKSA